MPQPRRRAMYKIVKWFDHHFDAIETTYFQAIGSELINPMWNDSRAYMQNVLPRNRVKTRSREIGCYNDRIVLKFERHICHAAAEVPVKFQNDWKSPN